MDWTFRMYLDAGLLLVGWAFFVNLFVLSRAYPVTKIAGPVSRVIALVTTGFALFAPPVPGSGSAVMITVVAVWWGLYAGGVLYRLFTYVAIVTGQPPRALERMVVQEEFERTMISLGRQDLVTDTALKIGGLTPDERKQVFRAGASAIKAMRAEWAENYEKRRREER
ncbi:hypothetical protein KDW85_27125 [Burkholderia cenocepacia]|uniref:hypothetical protein n=1 Tax=Burkholderia cenocepacia TaxID=95486 RepID=UPI001B9C17D9|nr:hypothetical protein [Burkholderia cenocepacia]MBR8042078.1 hypothetical protein [Burkholderia cenocepacia]